MAISLPKTILVDITIDSMIPITIATTFAIAVMLGSVHVVLVVARGLEGRPIIPIPIIITITIAVAVTATVAAHGHWHRRRFSMDTISIVTCC